MAITNSPPRCRIRYGHPTRSEEHTSELQSHSDLVCRLLLEKKKKKNTQKTVDQEGVDRQSTECTIATQLEAMHNTVGTLFRDHQSCRDGNRRTRKGYQDSGI